MGFPTLLKTAAAWMIAGLMSQTLPIMANAQAAPPPPEAVLLGQGVVGALYRPAAPTGKAGIAVFVMHAEQDYTKFPACTELSARGYTVLCANNSASKSGYMSDLDFETMMLDVKKGVEFLRGQPEFRKVVLFGHSGGGAMMAAYQNIAENGLSACQGPEKIAPCSDRLADLPKADGLVLADANYGISGMTLLSLDPAIEDESRGTDRDPALDLFSASNGFAPAGANYSPAFLRNFQAGSAARMQRLVAHAQERKAAIAAGKGAFTDDEPMTVPGALYVGYNNKLLPQDPRLLSRTSQAWPLLRKDGSVTTEVVRTVRVPSGRDTRGSFNQGALKTTVNRFLTTFAIRVGDDFSFGEDGFTGVDWSSSHTATIGAAGGINSPLLALGMTGGWEFLASEKLYLAAPSTDKSIAFVEGARHAIMTCTECEKTPGEFGDTTKTAFDYLDGWLSKPGRFLN